MAGGSREGGAWRRGNAEEKVNRGRRAREMIPAVSRQLSGEPRLSHRPPAPRGPGGAGAAGGMQESGRAAGAKRTSSGRQKASSTRDSQVVSHPRS